MSKATPDDKWQQWKSLTDSERDARWQVMTQEERKSIHEARVDADYPPLIAAVIKDDVEAVRKLLAEKADPNVKDSLGDKPLFYIQWDQKANGTKIAALLIDAGADVNARGFTSTPLGTAAHSSNAGGVQYLINRGAKVNLKLSDKPYDTSTALHRAVTYSKNPDVTEVLLKNGASPHAPGLLGNTPLHAAVTSSKKWYSGEFTDKTKVVKLLLAYGAKVNARNNSGETPLMEMASINPEITLAEILIAHKADINAKDKLVGETALHKAATNGYLAFTELLLKNGAVPDAKDQYGLTPRDTMIAFNNAALREGSTQNILQKITSISAGKQETDFNALDQLLLAAEVDEIRKGKLHKFKKKFGF